jgi:hypothetical protein
MNDYYVYVYLDPRKPGNYNYSGLTFNHEPFYVGKGKGDRFKAHHYECHSYNQYKWNKIQKIKKLGLEPIILKIVENLTEKEAFFEESITISKIGRSILTNMSNGGEGQSGYKHTEESKRKIGDGVKNSEKWQAAIKSDEHRKKLSNALMGHEGLNKGGKRSEEDIQKIKDGLKKSTKQSGVIKHTEESKKKMSEKRKGTDNINSTTYKIKTPNNDIIEIKGRENVRKYLENTPVKLSVLYKYNSSANYTIIDKIKGY